MLLQISNFCRHLKSADERSAIALERFATSLEQEAVVLSGTEREIKRIAHSRAGGVSRARTDANIPDGVLEERVKRLLLELGAPEAPTLPNTEGMRNKLPIPPDVSTGSTTERRVPIKDPLNVAQVEYVLNPNVPLVEGAIPHHQENGEVDYWLINKPGEANVSKVVPLSVTELGTSVYRKDDGGLFLITLTGGWMGSN